MDRLQHQFEFLLQADKLKTVIRRNYISDGSKRENDAEHSWFFALAALVLAEHANATIDVSKVLAMAVLHDIVEVYAGDTFIYDEKAKESQEAKEKEAADKIFGILPEDQRSEFRSLWDEFEAGTSPEARYAKAIDRISAVILNHASGGKAWRENNVGYAQVYAINQKINDGSTALWNYIGSLIDEGRKTGLFFEGG